MSQTSNLYQHMLDVGPITPLEAFRLYGALATHSRIAELRERGIPVKCEMIEVNGKRVGRYSLDLTSSGLNVNVPSVSPASTGASNSAQIDGVTAGETATEYPQGQRHAVVNPSMELRHEPRRADPTLFESAP